MKTKNKIISLVIGAAALLPLEVMAQEYPTRPVTIVVPFSPGGPGDLTARFVAKGLTTELGQPFVIENRPGANGVLAANSAAEATADGYTLLQISTSHTVNESLVDNRAYDLMGDFDPLASLNFTELVLVAKNDLSANTVSELIALAKADPDKLNYASSGNGSGYHLAAELFKSMAGVSITHIPYKGASTARTDLVGGQVDIMFDALPASIELIRGNKVKALATTAKSRSSVLSDVPTVGETTEGYDFTIFVGLMAPKGTPTAILDTLHAAINKVLDTDESREFWRKQGAQPLVMGRAEFESFLNDEIKQGEHLVEISGAKVD